MKMLKKAAAVLLAAAMSLVMLTACGGGSGSSASLTAQALGDKYTVKYTLVEMNGQKVPGYTTTVMSDGTNSYSSDSDSKAATLTTADASYTVNPKNMTAFKDEERDSMADTMTKAMGVASTGTTEYEGKTYVTETATFDLNGGKVSMSYCFYNGKMEYMMQKVVSPYGQTYSWVYKVDSIVKSVDAKTLDLSSYTLVDDYDGLGFED